MRDRWQERAPRRRDVNAPTWFKGGIPSQNMKLGTDNFEGLAQFDRRPLQTYQTEQGPIALPYGPEGDVSYMPSVSTLQGIVSTGTRRTAISDRYYR